MTCSPDDLSETLQRGYSGVPLLEGIDWPLSRNRIVAGPQDNAKDRIVRCDRFEGGDRRIMRNRQVLAPTGGHSAPGLEDWRAVLGRDFDEHDWT